MSNNQRKFLRLRAVIEVTGLAKSSIYAKAKDGTFPAPFKIGERAAAWDADEVAAWQAARIKDRVAA